MYNRKKREVKKAGLKRPRKEKEENDTVGYKSSEKKQKKRRRFPKPKGRLTQAERLQTLTQRTTH